MFDLRVIFLDGDIAVYRDIFEVNHSDNGEVLYLTDIYGNTYNIYLRDILDISQYD